MTFKLYTIVALVLLVVGGESYALWRAYHDGEAKVKSAVTQAAQAQKAQDDKVSADTAKGLQDEIDQLRTDAQPIPVVRLCADSSAVRKAPATRGPVSPGKPAPASGGVPAVPESTGSGPDVGPGLHQLAVAADLVSARDRACLQWADGVSH